MYIGDHSHLLCFIPNPISRPCSVEKRLYKLSFFIQKQNTCYVYLNSHQQITFPLHIMNLYQESKSGHAYALLKMLYILYQVLGSTFLGSFFLLENLDVYNNIYTLHNPDSFYFFIYSCLCSLLTNKLIFLCASFLQGKKSISLCPNVYTLMCRSELNISVSQRCARNVHFISFNR